MHRWFLAFEVLRRVRNSAKMLPNFCVGHCCLGLWPGEGLVGTRCSAQVYYVEHFVVALIFDVSQGEMSRWQLLWIGCVGSCSGWSHWLVTLSAVNSFGKVENAVESITGTRNVF